jgi:hypothetical protein
MFSCFGLGGEMRYYRQRELYIGGYGRLINGGAHDGLPYILLTVDNPPKYRYGERWRLEAFVETVALCVYRKLCEDSAKTAAIAHGLCGVKGMIMDLNARAMFAERADGPPVTAEERAAMKRFWVIIGDAGGTSGPSGTGGTSGTGGIYRIQCDTVLPGSIRYAPPADAMGARRSAEIVPATPVSGAPRAAVAEADWDPLDPEDREDPLDKQELLRAYMLTSDTLVWAFAGVLATLALALRCGLM